MTEQEITEQEIVDAYNKYAQPSAYKLFKIMKGPTLKRIQAAIDKQLTHQLHKREPKNKVVAHMIAYFENETWLADLIDMSNFARSNNGYKWILLVIDVFTRRAYAKALKSKSAEDVLNGFEEIVLAKGMPGGLITDNGSEFTNREFQRFISRVHHTTAEPGYHPTLGVIDSLTKTIKGKIFKRFTLDDSTNWIKPLGEILTAYNNTPHSGIGMIAPSDAMIPENKQKIQDINIAKNQRPKHKFKAGQLVRRKLNKGFFKKGYKQTYSSTTYTIKEIQGVNAVLNNDDVVKLNDLQRVEQPDALPPKESKVRVAEKKARVHRKIREEGINVEDIVDQGTKRSRKQRPILDDGAIFY
jgi:hypothetical protein